MTEEDKEALNILIKEFDDIKTKWASVKDDEKSNTLEYRLEIGKVLQSIDEKVKDIASRQ